MGNEMATVLVAVHCFRLLSENSYQLRRYEKNRKVEWICKKNYIQRKFRQKFSDCHIAKEKVSEECIKFRFSLFYNVL